MDPETNRNNRIHNHEEVEDNVNQDPQNQEPNLELPPLLRDMPGFDEFREAINELLQEEIRERALQEERARALPENVPQVQPPNGARGASATNGHPPVPPQDHAAEDENLGFNPNAAPNGNSSGPIADPGNDSNSDNDVPVESNDG